MQALPPPTRTLTLIVAACKGPRLPWMIEKCTELGVARIFLAEFERSVARPGEHGLEKLRRVAVEACKQCGSNSLPAIASGLSLAGSLEQSMRDGPGARPDSATPDQRERTAAARLAGKYSIFVADPASDAAPADRWFMKRPAHHVHTIAIVGPEGGLAQAELDYLAGISADRVRLAANTLRIETAAISIAALWAAAL